MAIRYSHDLSDARPSKPVEASPRAEHRLLHRVLRLERRGEHPVAVAGQLAAMLLQQLLELGARDSGRRFHAAHDSGRAAESRTPWRNISEPGTVSTYASGAGPYFCAPRPEGRLRQLSTNINEIALELDDSAEEPAELDLSYNPTDGGVPDSLTLFMSELGRYPLLTAAEEVELAKRIERGDRSAKERMINSNLRLVVHERRKVHGPRRLARRPRPGGDHRPQPRSREVRLAARLQVLDLRDLVDPPGLPARGREPVEDHPHSRAHRRAAQQAAPHRQRFEIEQGRTPTLEEMAEAAGLSLRHAEEALEPSRRPSR